jgi:outer membrane protein assembly factor BamB
MLGGPAAVVGESALVVSHRVYDGAFSLPSSKLLWYHSAQANFCRTMSPDGAILDSSLIYYPGLSNGPGETRKPAANQEVVVMGPYNGWVVTVASEDGRELWIDRPGFEVTPKTERRFSSDGVPLVLRLPGKKCYANVTLFERTALCPTGEGGVVAYDALTGFRRWGFKDEVDPGEKLVPRNHLAIAPATRRLFYASLGGSLYCLDLDEGTARWRRPWRPWSSTAEDVLNTGFEFAPVVARRDAGEVVYVRDNEALRALDVRDGSELWQQKLPPRPCAPAVHGGALYVTSGHLVRDNWAKPQDCSVHCFAPAARLYRLGYELPRQLLAPTDEPRVVPWPEDFAPEVLNLRFRLTEEPDTAQLLTWLKQQHWPEASCRTIVSLEWRDPQSDGLILPEALAGKGFADRSVSDLFLDRCTQLAKALRPAYFDLGPECNFLLRSHPEEFKGFVKLAARARDRIVKASPETKVLVTLQYELWQGWNSHLDSTGRKPGRLRSLRTLGPNEKLTTQFGLAQAFDKIVDCLGISTDPAAICAKPAGLPLDYYCRLANATKKPLLFMSLGWPAGADGDREAQKEFVDVFSRRIYWLDPAAVIWPAYDPDTAKELGCEGYSLAAAKDAAPPKAWQELVRWRTLPHRPQPGPPIVLAKTEEGF